MSEISSGVKGKDNRLRVKDAFKDDSGQGRIRIDAEVVKRLKLKNGDAIEISNPISKLKTAALLFPSKPEDTGTGIIRLDAFLRRNIDTTVDDSVEIRKIKVALAEKVVFAGLTESVVISPKRLNSLLENRVVTKNDILSFYSYNKKYDFVVLDFLPKTAAVRIHSGTEIKLSEKTHKEIIEKEKSRVSYEDIGGLADEIQRIREMIELPLRHPELFKTIGIDPPKGVLLHGPPGTGKTLLARAVAFETDAHFITISGPEIMSKFYGQSEQNLRDIFEDAKKNAPSIIFIDELDSIAPKRGEVTGEVERRVVAQLLSLLDGLEGRGEIIVIGATNRVNDIDIALRRPGRFDKEIEIGVPGTDGRFEILQIHTRGMPLFEDVNLRTLAEKTHGFVGADVEALAKEAAMLSIREMLPKIDLDKPIPFEILSSLRITMENFTSALNNIEPSALREVVISQPKERWEDVGGLEDAKLQLREVIEWPLKYPELYTHLSSKPPSGILLYGPPGTGKTLLARALAHESEVNFISVKGPEFFSKWVGESEKAVRETFRKARSAAPCIIFFDEVDAIAGMRGRSGSSEVTDQVISQLLTEMDGLEDLNGVILLAATNRPDMLDPALLRSGRFGRHIEIYIPDFETRKEIFKIHLKNKPLAEDVDIDKLAKALEDYTGADIKAIAEEATLLTIRKEVPTFNKKKAELQELKDHLEQLQSEKDNEKAIHEVEDEIKSAQSELVGKIEIKQAEFDEAIDKIIKGADRAKKVHDQYSKETNEMYR